MATSGARVQLAIAPAGSGKTTAMVALARAWESSGGTVVGLAPSAAAAAVLRENTRTQADTLAKLAWHLEHSPDELPEWAATIDDRTLVVIDEAGMVDTLSLDRAVEFITARSGLVRLIGDYQQLASVGAGGVLRDIRATHGALHLTELMRFTAAAEGAASLEPREGKPSALGFYLDAQRVHVGDLATMAEEVFQAWRADRAEGRDAIMLAPTRELVSELNQRARDHRIEGSTDPGQEVSLSDGNRASVGEIVITRRNDRQLRTAVTDWVKNGDRWTVLEVLADGGVAVQHNQNGRHIVLPADYVAVSVELGYASTVHTAQGVSVDVTHGLATGAESRQQLYTMMTRGRHGNHVYLQVVGDGNEHEAIKPGTISPLTATDVLENILARDESPTSASSMLRDLDDPATLLGRASARYVDALYTAATQTMGDEQLERLDTVAEACVSGMTEAPAWPTLRAHLTLMAAAGDDPVRLLRNAVFSREFDTAGDPAAVVDWRLDDTGMRNTHRGPLPWIPGVPTVLTTDPVWGDYLTRRADRVSVLARQVAADATIGPAPDWASQGAARPSDELLAKVAVWRAANQIDDTDLRPTGPRQPAKAAATYQSTLRALVQGGAHPSRPGVGPLLAEVLSVRQDPFVPVLAERLAAASRAGIDAAALVRQATTRPLPDDHAAAALWWRLAEHLAPAGATATDTTHLVSTGWAPALAEALGADRAQQVQSSPWWPVLVTTVDHALRRGWSMTDLAGTAPSVGADVDDAQSMTWTITTLMDDPTHLAEPTDHAAAPEDCEEVDVAPAKHSVQATEGEYRQHIETITAADVDRTATSVEDVDEPDPVAVEAGLVLAATYRQLMGPLEPSEQERQRAYDRNMDADRSPVPLERLAAINAMALEFYEQQLTRPGGGGPGTTSPTVSARTSPATLTSAPATPPLAGLP